MEHQPDKSKQNAAPRPTTRVLEEWKSTLTTWFELIKTLENKSLEAGVLSVVKNLNAALLISDLNKNSAEADTAIDAFKEKLDSISNKWNESLIGELRSDVDRLYSKNFTE